MKTQTGEMLPAQNHHWKNLQKENLAKMDKERKKCNRRWGFHAEPYQ